VLFGDRQPDWTKARREVRGGLHLGKLGILSLFVVAGLLCPALSFSRLGPTGWVSPLEIVGSGMLVFLIYEVSRLIANASGHIRKPATTLPVAFYGLHHFCDRPLRF
jgi:hypothetical protein